MHVDITSYEEGIAGLFSAILLRGASASFLCNYMVWGERLHEFRVEACAIRAGARGGQCNGSSSFKKMRLHADPATLFFKWSLVPPP
jgi:hypothetical protein